MAKYYVTYLCGHDGVENITGTNVNGERDRKLKWIEENKLCYDCYIKEQIEGCKEIEMHYKEYKDNYANCRAKKGSYNKESKTIIVYVPIG